MPKIGPNRIPKPHHHRPSNQARLRLGGKDTYLGEWGSRQAREAYDRFLSDWLASGRTSTPAVATVTSSPPRPGPGLTVADALLSYREHARRYYAGSRELDNLGLAVRPFREMFAAVQLEDLRASHLRSYRERLISRGLARSTVNQRVLRIRRFVRWCVGNDLVDPSVSQRFAAVEPLMPGRGGRETCRREPVSWSAVEATLPHLPAMLQALVIVAWHTGARPSELAKMTTLCIDRSGAVCVAVIAEHKNSHRGQARELLIGPRAQESLRPWLMPDQPGEPIFGPRRVDARQPGRRGKRHPNDTYSRCSLGQALRRACDRAGVPRWTLYQLRHAAATRLRDIHGLAVAQQVLGHARPDATLIYSHQARQRATGALKETG